MTDGAGGRKYDRYGRPKPSSDDQCTCGRRRDEAEELFIEVHTPFGETTYTCKRCQENERGMK